MTVVNSPQDMVDRANWLSDLRETRALPIADPAVPAESWIDLPFATGMRIRVVAGPDGSDERRRDVIGLRGELSRIDDHARITERRYLFTLENGETVNAKDIWWIRIDGEGAGNE
jgi:hypothetical protein